MSFSAHPDPARETHGDWIRLQTLILLRWGAIGGQLAAITVAWRIYKVDLNLGACFLAVGAAIIANLVSVFVFPLNKRLTETQAMLTLLFDVAQLAVLLALTGGLHNPFALLILAPATIGATALRTQSTVMLVAATVAMITAIGWVNLPLRLIDGTPIRVPALFEFGHWLAIVIGVVFLAVYARRVSSEVHSMSEALLAAQLALAREQKLTDLGGVVAAAAHELGTPLATIKLASSELVDELEDRPDLREDALLIRAQADRCRDILRSMGRAGKSDLQVTSAPFLQVVQEAAEPHADRGKTLHIAAGPLPGGDPAHPAVLRLPELIHGIRNLVQNAVDFAAQDVWIDIDWTPAWLRLRIADDGPGFPPHLLGRIGDPFMRRRRTGPQPEPEPGGDPARPGYEGMGLGLFIAKTLLERTGAELSFANGSDPFLSAEERPERCGAIVEVRLPRDRLTPRGGPLGDNPRLTP
ncbi:sensor histidine kinase RegB [Frigidibacter oleivorans]|uniref:sensor histidine kinase RegB n=1 Tax=Frigidibacter oleivorans TaxID=2487129 RepID=UPI000F8F08A8|nr:ActS/PrrB/RegB family redox-sensitive histidine kinase [Frigidibacter oleivorans]